jgi:hypothetical protein
VPRSAVRLVSEPSSRPPGFHKSVLRSISAKHYTGVRASDELCSTAPLATMRNDPSTKIASDVPFCPKCYTRLNFCRSEIADVDAAGLESYRLDCQQCGTALVGIVDPADDALIVSEWPSPADNP